MKLIAINGVKTLEEIRCIDVSLYKDITNIYNAPEFYKLDKESKYIIHVDKVKFHIDNIHVNNVKFRLSKIYFDTRNHHILHLLRRVRFLENSEVVLVKEERHHGIGIHANVIYKYDGCVCTKLKNN